MIHSMQENVLDIMNFIYGSTPKIINVSYYPEKKMLSRP